MKKILVLATCSLILLGCGDGGNEIQEIKREEVVERYEDGEKKLVVIYKGEGNDEKIINKKYYRFDGSLEQEEEFDVDKKTISKYDYSGVFWQKQVYENNKLIYDYELDFDIGQGKEYNYNMNGEYEGVCKDFLIEGDWTYEEFDEFIPNDPLNLILIKEEHYLNGVLNGIKREFHWDGKLLKEGNFNNGKEDGIHKEWNVDGSLKSETEYKDGILQVSDTGNNNQDLNEVKIGNQIWMKNNLNLNKFQNGDVILQAKTKEEWKMAYKNKQPAWCYYDNNPNNGQKYGKIYNYYALNDQRELAPKGWHIASKNEFLELARSTKEVDIERINAKAGGYRDKYGNFKKKGEKAIWKCATRNTSEKNWGYSKKIKSNFSKRAIDPKEGAYVRCVKNK